MHAHTHGAMSAWMALLQKDPEMLDCMVTLYTEHHANGRPQDLPKELIALLATYLIDGEAGFTASIINVCNFARAHPTFHGAIRNSRAVWAHFVDLKAPCTKVAKVVWPNLPYVALVHRMYMGYATVHSDSKRRTSIARYWVNNREKADAFFELVAGFPKIECGGKTFFALGAPNSNSFPIAFRFTDYSLKKMQYTFHNGKPMAASAGYDTVRFWRLLMYRLADRYGKWRGCAFPIDSEKGRSGAKRKRSAN